MDNWNNAFKEKLGEYSYNQPPDDAKVQAFFDRLDDEQTTNSASTSKSVLWVRWAASVAILVTISFIGYQLSNKTISTQNGQFADHLLPDGSKVSLSNSSTLKFNQLNWMLGMRKLQFEGEGFFEVEKGSTFTVRSTKGVTSVLGTSFNISTYEGNYEVKCFTGKVRVDLAASNHMLTSGEAVLFAQNKVNPFKFDTKTPSWYQGEIHHENVKMALVFSSIERIYDVTITNKTDFETLLYTGFYPTNNLEMALRLIFSPFGLTARVEGQTVTIVRSE